MAHRLRSLMLTLVSCLCLFACSGHHQFVTARDAHFFPGENSTTFIGVNIYSLASFPESNKFGCGRRFSDEDIDRTFNEMQSMGARVIRIWAFQSFTENGGDFSRLDFLIKRADAHNLKLILTLENEWEDCTHSAYKNADWYREGYKKPYGSYKLSYRDYVSKIVRRYRDEPAVMMWQLMNEAESKTNFGSADPFALLSFAADVSGLIKSLDSDHLVSLGTVGGNHSGTADDAYIYLHAIPTIDVVEAHDYSVKKDLSYESKRCVTTAKRLGKPCFLGEVGLSLERFSEEERAQIIAAKLAAARAQGVAGVLIWSYKADDRRGMNFDASDPLFKMIRKSRDIRPATKQ